MWTSTAGSRRPDRTLKRSELGRVDVRVVGVGDGELPGEVVGVADGRVHAEAAGRRHLVRGVAREEGDVADGERVLEAWVGQVGVHSHFNLFRVLGDLKLRQQGEQGPLSSRDLETRDELSLSHKIYRVGTLS